MKKRFLGTRKMNFPYNVLKRMSKEQYSGYVDRLEKNDENEEYINEELLQKKTKLYGGV